jgi:hypothetical protein
VPLATRWLLLLLLLLLVLLVLLVVAVLCCQLHEHYCLLRPLLLPERHAHYADHSAKPAVHPSLLLHPLLLAAQADCFQH